MKNLILFTIYGLIYQTQAFSTTTCKHADILDSFTSYKSCYAKDKTAIQAQFCLAFDTADRCVHDSFTTCFGDNTAIISNITQIELRYLTQKTLATLKFSEQVVDLVLNTCPKAPLKLETDSYTQKMFYWLDFAQTDNKCTVADVDEVQTGLQECLETQSHKFKTELTSRMSRARGNLRKTICQTLYDTCGECWRTKFHSCFSKREIDYVKDEMSSTFKAGYELVTKKLTTSVNLPEVDVVGCLEGNE